MSLFDGRKRELRDEIESHLRMAAADRVAAGATPEDARRDAMREFGNVPLVADVTRERWGWGWLESLLQDVRFALRQLWKTPGFTVTAILTLALGIGANSAIFTLVNAVLLKNLPVADPKSLVHFGDRADCCQYSGANPDGSYSLFSTDTYRQLRQGLPEFEDLAAMQAGYEYRPVIARLDGGQDEARSVMGEFVSGNYFRMFGLQPAAGRTLSDADDVDGIPMVAVMSYETWKQDYAGDSGVVGRTLWVNTRPVTVVGVAPQGFFGDRVTSKPPNYYMPLESMRVLAGADYVHDPEEKWIAIIGRVRPGVSQVVLQAKVSALLKHIYAPMATFSAVQDKPLLEKVHVVLTPGGAGIQEIQRDIHKDYSQKLMMLMGISGLVLLIACANIANLLLVRGMARKTELSVRAAMGAKRWRLVRQLLTESVVLAALSGAAALAVSYLGTWFLLVLAFPGEKNVPIHASPSPEVIGFALGLSMLTGILFGVAPAWIAARAEPADALKTGGRAVSGGASLLQRTLVVLQAALSVVLLVGAGLFAHSLSKLEHTDMKLESKNRYIVHINPQSAGYATTQVEALYRAIEEQFHAIPGVVKVGISTYTPMEDNDNGYGIKIVGQPDLHVGASFDKANAEYFDSVGTHVRMGRGIGAQDTSTASSVAVVNEDFVKALFKPGENPIGHRFGSPGGYAAGAYEIVGVVDGTSYLNVQRNGKHPMYFVPLMQRPTGTTQPIEKDFMLYAGAMVIETAHPMSDMESLAQRTLAGINPNLSVVKFQTFDEQIADRFTDQRMLSRLMTLFGGLALLLATVGLYGVTSYTVARRTSEIGIRMALGAERSSVVVMVLRGALWQTALGLLIGIPVAYYGVVLVKSQLYELTTVSGGALAVAVGTLLAAACLAGLIPARQAASVDPVRALRAE